MVIFEDTKLQPKIQYVNNFKFLILRDQTPLEPQLEFVRSTVDIILGHFSDFFQNFKKKIFMKNHPI